MVVRRPVLAALGALAVAGAVASAAIVMSDDDDELTSSDSATTTEATSTTTTTAVTTSSTAATSTSAPATTVAPPSSQPPPTTASTPSTASPAPPFESSIEPVTLAELGSSWKPDMGCPDPGSLRALDVSHWGYDGAVHVGRIIVAAAHADRMVAVFRDIYTARFPIQSIIPVDAFGADDQASMRANNTSGFNCRTVAGTNTLSQHGRGLAIDVNPLVNPYVKGGTVDPPEGAPYADRSVTAQGMIRAGDAVVQAFARQGWSWGGYWSSGPDYQHFSASGG